VVRSLAVADIEETELPGVGVRREFTTQAGMRLGVIQTRTGRRDLLLYDADDPDACRSLVPLDEHDSDVLIDLLGGDRVVNEATSTLLQIDDLAIDWVAVDLSSPSAGRTIGDLTVRTATGASIAAVMIGDDAVPGPGPEVVLPGGAMVVAVGTVDAVARLRTLLGP